jgi:hypothetical protein
MRGGDKEGILVFYILFFVFFFRTNGVFSWVGGITSYCIFLLYHACVSSLDSGIVRCLSVVFLLAERLPQTLPLLLLYYWPNMDRCAGHTIRERRRKGLG